MWWGQQARIGEAYNRGDERTQKVATVGWKPLNIIDQESESKIKDEAGKVENNKFIKQRRGEKTLSQGHMMVVGKERNERYSHGDQVFANAVI